ncbi:GAF domain-containing SpoIIE family protein phosphatase [Spirillospora sp. NPDC127506]
MSRDEVDRALLERQALLDDAGNALASTLDLAEGLRRVCRVLTTRFGDWCAVNLLDEVGQLDRVTVVHRTRHAADCTGFEGPLPPLPPDTEGAAEAAGPLPQVLHGRGTVLLTDLPAPDQAATPLDARQLQLFHELGTDSAIIVPLRARREILGSLTVARTDPDRPFTQHDVGLLEDLVRGLALQVDNTRLHQQTRHVAERFQRALLPEPAGTGHLRQAVRYLPSQTSARVGGDWYDSFVLPGGDTALVIGDVTGHDVRAAVTMSTLRNMLRGIATDRQTTPGDILRRMDQVVQTLHPHATATCLYALVKGPPNGPWRLDHASAGHPPPLLTTHDGHTRYLEEGAGLLIGVDPDQPRPTAHHPLPPHSTLLLYTDGLIEHRDEPLDHGLARPASTPPRCPANPSTSSATN